MSYLAKNLYVKYPIYIRQMLSNAPTLPEAAPDISIRKREKRITCNKGILLQPKLENLL